MILIERLRLKRNRVEKNGHYSEKSVIWRKINDCYNDSVNIGI